MARDDAVLLDVHRAAKLILAFVERMGEEQFLRDVKTQSAVLHQPMIVGEAVKRLSDETRSAHIDIPWRLIAGMRDRLIHAYNHVDLEEVWRAVHRDVPQLIAKL